MKKQFRSFALIAVPLIVLANGCKQQTSTQPLSQSPAPKAYFQTQFQTESQYIIETIVSDIAEQIYYAAKHKLPDPKYFVLTSTEKPGSPIDAPLYELQIGLDQQHQGIKLDLNINGPIWSADVYRDVTAALAKETGAKSSQMNLKDSAAFIGKLLDGTGETIERQNQRLSDALEENFVNPRLHEQAAVLLGAFMLRERSNYFYDIRSPLCRLTAHLAMAQFLEGMNSIGVSGRMADAMMLTLVGNEAPALEMLKTFDMNDAAVVPFVRALEARNTGDFRALSKAAHHTQVESVACFYAMADYSDSTTAWQKLNKLQRQTIDFVRAANDVGYSVETGHELLESAIPLELQEEKNIYGLTHDDKPDEAGIIKALNEMPDRCLTSDPKGQIHVHVIGWGQWAAFLQRELCHAVQQNYHFMSYMWGVPDEAKKFAAECDERFAGLRLYPFVRRFVCTDVETYRKSVDDGLKVTVATPQLVSADCWNKLCYKPYFAPSRYLPNPNPHLNEWHNHNPPPGTLYDLNPRLDHPSLINRPDAMAKLEQLHQLAPYWGPLSDFIVKRKYHDKPTYDQLMKYYGDLQPWCPNVLKRLASTVYDTPERYKKLMLQAAELNPACYYDMGDYAWNHKDEDKAAEYLEKACELDGDSVRVANHATWRVRYYMKKGQVEKARGIADFGAEVYSGEGLTAKAVFFELTSNYTGAFEMYSNIEERYNQPYRLAEFCLRYQLQTGDKRFEPELQKRIKALFPRGIEKVSLANFKDAPKEGVLIRTATDVLTASHMKKGDVIVALNGTRVYDFTQYCYVREKLETPKLDLIVWQDNAYHEIEASPPNHRFGGEFGDYRQN